MADKCYVRVQPLLRSHHLLQTDHLVDFSPSLPIHSSSSRAEGGLFPLSKSRHLIAPLLKTLLWRLGTLETKNPHSSLRPVRTPGPGPADLSSLVAACLALLQPLGSFFKPLNTPSWFLPRAFALVYVHFAWDLLPLAPFPRSHLNVTSSGKLLHLN